MWNPVNRTTVQVEENKYRIYPKQGPLFYKNKDGGFGEIDLTFNDTSSSIGEIAHSHSVEQTPLALEHVHEGRHVHGPHAGEEPPKGVQPAHERAERRLPRQGLAC